MPGAPGRFHPHYAPESGKVNRQESATRPRCNRAAAHSILMSGASSEILPDDFDD